MQARICLQKLQQNSLKTQISPWNFLITASYQTKRFPLPPDFKDVEFPENRKLRILEKVPNLPGNVRPKKPQKRLRDLRGPELVHNQLIHKQFGIMALTGGMLRHAHMEVIRNVINKKMDIKTMFAVWRIDAPWKARTKKGQGKRMGGGKGNIHHYVTPVKAGRIIFEMGGKIELEDVYPLLKEVRGKLPFPSEIISEEILKQENDKIIELRNRNENPYSFEYIVKNNMLGCDVWISPYDRLWYGKFP